MKTANFLSLSSLLCCASLNASSMVERTNLTIETDIDVSKLYQESIEYEFDPRHLDLTLKADKSSYEPAQSQLKITTTIPKAVSAIAYTVELTGNKVWCTGYDNVRTLRMDSSASPHFVTATISQLPVSGCSAGSEMPIAYGEKEAFADFCGDDGTYKANVHSVKLTFGSFYDLSIPTHPGLPQECDGELLFDVKVAL